MVADALSRRVMFNLRAMFARLSLFDDGSLLAELQVKSGSTSNFGLNNDDILCFQGRICVPNDSDLRQSILREVKAEHQLPSGFLQPVKIPLWKWKRVTMDFINGQQKSYADLKRHEIEYAVGDLVFLKARFDFEEEPVQILDRDVKVLGKKSIPLVKVMCSIIALRRPCGNLSSRCVNSILIYLDQVLLLESLSFSLVELFLLQGFLNRLGKGGQT
ncbi:uncharacterized protein LOC128292697 [Gossypium arboreum]|uniref:uncharacterized protein LOC128292697 n=1 Tax=Gossypium arboreum TaxID=29729 RepID=UPI0022F1CCE1|nr:uncharacterized protein LOC128292697 [Gossypium arboreum]